MKLRFKKKKPKIENEIIQSMLEAAKKLESEEVPTKNRFIWTDKTGVIGN